MHLKPTDVTRASAIRTTSHVRDFFVLIVRPLQSEVAFAEQTFKHPQNAREAWRDIEVLRLLQGGMTLAFAVQTFKHPHRLLLEACGIPEREREKPKQESEHPEKPLFAITIYMDKTEVELERRVCIVGATKVFFTNKRH